MDPRAARIASRWLLAAQVAVDFRPFETVFRRDLAGLINSITQERAAPGPDLGELVQEARGLVPPQLVRRMKPGDTAWIKPVSDFLYETVQNPGDDYDLSSRAFDLSRKLYKYQDALGEQKDPEAERKELEEQGEAMRVKARLQVKGFTQTVSQAAGRVPAWQGSRLALKPQLNDTIWDRWADGKPLITTVTVHVGGIPSFTVFLNGTKVHGVEDVLEGGDTDFFRDLDVAADYFNLVKELRKPGSSSRGRDLRLWTARPTKDRRRYENARTVPPNIFLTTSPDRAAGIAHDLGASEVRDIWKVVINEAYLVKTLDAGRLQDYQVVGSKPAPVKRMDLIVPGNPAGRRMAERVAERWLSRQR